MTVPITGSVKDVTGVEDNDTPWSFASVIRFADDGSVITEKPREVRAVSGNLKVNLVPGYAIVTYGKQVWQVTVPETATTLKALIEAGVAYPPDTSQALLDAAVGQYVEANREQFRTRAVPVVGDPTMAQWVDENGALVGDPIPWSEVVSTEVAQAAVEAEAPAAVGQAAADMNPVPVPGPTPGKIAISFNGTTGDEFNPLPASWDGLAAKPAVIAAGATEAAARESIGAVGRGEAAASLSADAYVDFTSKSDGDPPAVLDTGQSVDFLQNATGRKPQISNGKLVHGALPGSGAYAIYYQAQLDGDVRECGTRWTWDEDDGSTGGSMCLAAWSEVFEGNVGMTVPRTAIHFSITSVGGWAWWVSDGEGSGSSHLTTVKSGTFTAPALDGLEVWELAVYLDPDDGVGTAYLPGVDASTGTRFVTVTDAEVAAALTGASLSVLTIAELMEGTGVLQVEHFAGSNANTARYPAFLDMWGNVNRPSRYRSLAMRREASIEPAAELVRDTYKIHYPTSQLSATAGTPVAKNAVDITNFYVIQEVGPSGIVLLDISAWYEFAANDVLFWRCQSANPNAGNTAEYAVCAGVAGEKRLVTGRLAFTGRTPGISLHITLQHWTANAGSAVLKAGGSGGSYLPPVSIRATSL